MATKFDSANASEVLAIVSEAIGQQMDTLQATEDALTCDFKVLDEGIVDESGQLDRGFGIMAPHEIDAWRERAELELDSIRVEFKVLSVVRHALEPFSPRSAVGPRR